MAWRVAKLSVQSSTTSARPTSASRVPRPPGRLDRLEPGLRVEPVQRALAEATLGRPTMSAECRIWRCRLVRSTVSWSASARVPTPAAARYIAAGEPARPRRPPARAHRAGPAGLRRRSAAAGCGGCSAAAGRRSSPDCLFAQFERGVVVVAMHVVVPGLDVDLVGLLDQAFVGDAGCGAGSPR